MLKKKQYRRKFQIQAQAQVHLKLMVTNKMKQKIPKRKLENLLNVKKLTKMEKVK